MPGLAAHANLARHNVSALNEFDANGMLDRFPDWAATMAFYVAVHAVEAVFAHFRFAESQNHTERNEIIATDARFVAIEHHYRFLSTASFAARYSANLPRNRGVLTPATVRDHLINGDLRAIVAWAEAPVGVPGLFAPTPPPAP